MIFSWGSCDTDCGSGGEPLGLLGCILWIILGLFFIGLIIANGLG